MTGISLLLRTAIDLGTCFLSYPSPFSGPLFLPSLPSHISSLPGHIQVGQVPHRHEPDENGEINFNFFFKTLEEIGYKGWIGCEYHPRGMRIIIWRHIMVIISHTHIHTHTHTHTHTRAHTHTHMHTQHVHTHTHIPHMHAHTHTTHALTHAHTHTRRRN